MSRVFFNRNCPNCVCYNSRVLVCLVITTSTTNSTVKIIELKQTCLDSQLCSMLANDEDDLEEATATRIFDTVRKFCVAVINNMIKIFPFHDDVYVEGPCCTQSRPCASGVPELIICSRFGLVTDDHHDTLVAEFQDHELIPDDELPLYSSDSRVNTFWAEMAKKKFAGGMRFPNLAHLMTTLSVIADSNADSEHVFYICRKIDTDARSQLGNDTLHALLSLITHAMYSSLTPIC